MKKTTFMYTCITILMLLSVSFNVTMNAQCIGSFQWPPDTVVSDNSGLTQTLSTCNWTDGDFSVVNGLLIGQTYIFTITDGYITVTDPSNTVLGHGASPFTWASATMANVRVHYSDDSSCAGDEECRISTIRLLDTNTVAPGCSTVIFPTDGATAVPVGMNNFSWSVPTTGDPVVAYEMYYGLTATEVDEFVGSFDVPTAEINLDGFNATFYWKIVPVNAGGEAVGCAVWSFTTQEPPGYCLQGNLYPMGTYTPEFCDGVTTNTIVTNAFAGEFSNVVVEAGTSYTFQSSIGTDFITISDEDGVNPLVFGTTPLTWESTVTGTIRFYIHLNDICETEVELRVRSIICGDVSSDTPDWATLQWPPTANFEQGESVTVYGQVYVAGLTDVEPNIVGQAPGILAWVGISPEGENSNPSTWSNWVPATWNDGHVSNNDEYEAVIGSTLLAGTYYYAYRFRLNDGPFVYGGVNGFWDATGSISGVMTVIPPPAPSNNECENAIALIPGATFETNPITTSNISATLSIGHPIPTCSDFNFETNGKDVWYSVVVPASGSITIETQENENLVDTVMAAYSGTCGTLTQIACDDDGGTGLYSRIVLTGQTPGATIHVRVWGFSGQEGSFVLSAFDASLSASGFHSSSFVYYPNPVSDRLNISHQEVISNVIVYNLLGQEVMNFQPNATESAIDMSHLNTGNYLVKVISGNQSKTIKVIKR